MDRDAGLRERKKRETRESISAVATRLFMARGFDAVTVAEVASAANVSTKTVFNYFPRKEDLLLDRFPELIALITQAVHERPTGTSALRALRELLLGLLEKHHPLSGYAEAHYVHFWQVIMESPALQARIREFIGELEDLVTRLFAEAEGSDPAGIRATFAGAAAIAAYRSVYLTATRGITRGDVVTDVAELAARYNQTFDAVERALDGL